MKNFKITKTIVITFIISAVVIESQARRRVINNRRPRPPVQIEPEINDNPSDIKIDYFRLLNEPNSKIFRSDNQTREEITQEQNQQSFESGADIVLLPEQEELLNSNDDIPITRTGATWKSYRWPRDNNGKVNVPYEISSDYSESHSMHSMISP
jgi:hypothetical protein